MGYYLERIQRGVDFIEARLDEELSLADVARHAGMSRWHFQRMFKALTGETLKTYIRSRRLARALDRLLTTRLRILDIALLAGFESQESFSRAFKQSFEVTPQAYRKLGNKSLFLRKVQLDAEYLEHLQHNVSLTPEIDTRPALRLVGLRTSFYGVDSEKNNIGEKLPALWQAFLAQLEGLPARVPGVCYGVVRQTAEDGELLEYHAAAPVSDSASAPPGMLSLEVPAARYAVFAHRGDPRQIDHTVNYIYSTWLARSGHRHTYAADLEIYGPDYRMDSSESLFHYAIPIA